MHWRKRMMAIALAGGSVAACSEAAAPVDVEGTAPAPADEQSAGGPAAPPALTVSPALASEMEGTYAPARGYAIPRCNANPDPCCRMPDLPECVARDAGTGDDDADAGEVEAACDGAPPPSP